jgi:pre-mRNA cleavage complex 2 protein Pcf11
MLSLSLKVDEKTRQSLFKLRQTWSNIFPTRKLYAIDVRVNTIDPAWPITATAPESPVSSIHVNPKFINKVGAIP